MKEKAALLIIDMQNDFVLPGAPMYVAGALAVIPNIRKVLDWYRQRKLPVFHVVREHRPDGSDIEVTRLRKFLNGPSYCVPGTPGCEIVKALKPIEGEYRIVKKRFSAFMNTELDFILRRLGVTAIVVCGIQYPNCIRATVFDGVALGCDVILITDATGAQTEAVAQANIFDIANIGVSCQTTEQFLNLVQKD